MQACPRLSVTPKWTLADSWRSMTARTREAALFGKKAKGNNREDNSAFSHSCESRNPKSSRASGNREGFPPWKPPFRKFYMAAVEIGAYMGDE